MGKNKEYELAIKIAGEVEKSFLNSTKLSKKELQNIAKTASITSNGIKHSFKDGLSDVSGILNGLENIGQKAFKAVAAAGTAVITTGIGIGTAVIGVGSAFEEQMSTVQAISGASGKELDALKEKAKEMGATTVFSAKQAGEAMEYMAMAGWKSGNMINGIEGIMNLAAASGEDLGAVSDIVTDALTAFRMTAEESGHFADVLARASASSNTNVGMMGETFKYVASTAGAMGYNVEDTAIAIGLMANSGIKASQAGTQLRAAFVNMANPTDKQAAMMDKLGISILKENGEMKSLMEVMVHLREKTKSMSEEQKRQNIQILTGMDATKMAKEAMSELSEEEVYQKTALGLGLEAIKEYDETQLNSALYKQYTKKELAKMTEEQKRNLVATYQGTKQLEGLTQAEQIQASATIFGKEAMSGWLAILNASEKDFSALTEEIYNCEGAAKEMADIRLDNFNGDVTLLKSGLEGLGNQIYDDISEPLRAAVQWITEMVSSLSQKLKNTNVISNVVESFKKNLPTAIRHLKSFKKSFTEFAKPFLSVGEWLVKHPDIIISTLSGIGAVIATYKVAKGVMKVADSFKNLAGILTNPFAVAILAVGAAIGGAAGIATYVKKANDKLKEQNLAKHFGNIALSIDELKEAAAHIVETDNLGKLQESLKALEDTQILKNAINEAVNDLNKSNWKIKIGMELSEEELTSYGDNIQKFIEESQNLLLQQQYSLDLSLDVLTKDDSAGNAIKTKFQEFYNSNQKELARLGKDLGKAYSDALSDGAIDVPDIKIITEIQAKMAKITDKLTSSKFEAKLEVLGMKYAAGELDAESFQNLQAEIMEQLEKVTSQFDESLELNIASAKVMLDEKKINQTEYEDMVAEFKKNHLEQVGEVQLKATNFQFDTIMQQYSEELENVLPEFQGSLTEFMQQIAENSDAELLWSDDYIMDMLNLGDLDKSTRAALGELFQNMAPSIESLQGMKDAYRELGGDVTGEFYQSISAGLQDISALGAITKDTNALWACISNSVKSDECYGAFQTMHKNGVLLPEEIINGMEERKDELKKSIERIHKFMASTAQAEFSNGFNINIPFNFKYKINGGETLKNAIPSVNAKNILETNVNTYHADGGIFDKEHIAWVAEEGPESIIPLNGSKNAVDLWYKTGQLIGMFEKPENKFAYSKNDTFERLFQNFSEKNYSNENNYENDSSSIVYNPVINFYGGAPSKTDLNKANQLSMSEFEKLMNKYRKNKSRLALS